MRRSGKEIISKEIVCKLLEKLKNQNILVIGDSILDEYWEGKVERISPEAPVPVFEYISSRKVLGGAANTANNIRSLGGNVSLISLVGTDRNAKELINLCNKSGINTKFIINDNYRPTTTKTRIMVGNNQLLRIDQEVKVQCRKSLSEQIIINVKKNLKDYNAIIFSDYAKGLLSQELVKDIIAEAKSMKIKTFVDPVPSTIEFYKEVDYIKPNKKETETYIGENFNKEYSNAGEILKLLNKKFKTNWIVTLGKDGMLFNNKNNCEIIHTFSKDVFDVSGAGDTAMAALTLSISAGNSLKESIIFANICSGIVVGKIGTATCTVTDIKNYLDK
jgi:rfaE bifunctional protein kinase chain/domain